MAIGIDKGSLWIDGARSLLFSGEVHYWRIERRFWKPILQAVKDTGMEWVGFYIPWRVHDLGVHDYDFTGRTRDTLNVPAFLDLIAELGLRAYYRPGPLIVSELGCGGYPDWLGHSGPEYMVWTSTGEVPMGFPGEGNPGRSPCYLHPAYLAHCRRYLTAIDQVVFPYLKQNGGPIALLQLDNEVSMICRDAMFQSDYNPAIVGPGGEYHQWLTRTYGDVRNVPYAGQASCIEELAPPRDLKLWGKVHPRWFFDWAAFKEFILSDYIRRIKQVHLDAGVTDVSYCTNFNPHRPNSMPNNWAAEKAACDGQNPGIVGYDFYRGPCLSRTGYGSLSRISRQISSYFPLPWSAEFACGHWSEDYAGKSYPYAEHHEFMADVAIASGLRGISWYMFHDREYWGGSPVSAQGHKRYAWHALKNVMDFVNGAKDFGALQEPREVGILAYRPYLRHTYIGDASPCNDGEVYCGGPAIDGVPAGRTFREVEGLFTTLAKAGYHPGVVAPDVNPEDLGRYPAVFATTQTFMDPADQKWLLDYVGQGGCLILGPAVPRKDLDLEAASVLPDALTAERAATFARGSRLATPHGEVAVEGEFYRIGGEPVVTAATGEVLVSRLAHGRGVIFQLAGYFTQEDNPDLLGDNAALYRFLLETAGVRPGVQRDNDKVDVVLLQGGGETYLYLLNHHHQAQTVTVTLPGGGDGRVEDMRGDERIAVKNGRFTAEADTRRARLFRLVDAAAGSRDQP